MTGVGCTSRRPCLGAHGLQLRADRGGLVLGRRGSRFGVVLLALRVGQAVAKELLAPHKLGCKHVEHAGMDEWSRSRSLCGGWRRSARARRFGQRYRGGRLTSDGAGGLSKRLFGVIYGALAEFRALSGHALELAVGDLLQVQLFLPEVPVYDRTFPAVDVAAVPGYRRVTGEIFSGGRHGDQVRRFEEGVRDFFTPEAHEMELRPRRKKGVKLRALLNLGQSP